MNNRSLICKNKDNIKTNKIKLKFCFFVYFRHKNINKFNLNLLGGYKRENHIGLFYIEASLFFIRNKSVAGVTGCYYYISCRIIILRFICHVGNLFCFTNYIKNK